MINVLITSIGSNTAIGVVKALRLNKQVPVCIIGTDSFPKNLSAGSSMVDHFYHVPLANEEGYEEKLIDIIKTHKADCVIPIHDYEIVKVAALSLQFPSLTFWAVNDPAIISLCNNKKEINSFLSQQQVMVPEMYESVSGIQYPALYKPNMGVSSKGIQLIEGPASVLQQFDLNKGFFQKKVSGVEYTVDCYSSYKEKYFKCCVRTRIETKEGISTKGETVENDILENICSRIHQLLNYKGASNIQFIIDDNVPYFIEINPRFSGAGILSYYANLNSPLFTVLEAIGSPLFNEIKNIPVKKGVIMTRYWNEHFYEG